MQQDKVAILIKKAALEFEKMSNPYFAEYELTVAQYKVLKYLYGEISGTARVTDFEKCYSMTHPTTLGLLENLEKKGFIERIDNPNDKRGKLVSLTDKALNMRDSLLSLGDVIENRFTESLTKREKEELVALLLKLLCKSAD